MHIKFRLGAMQSEAGDQDEYEHAYHEDRVPQQWLPPYDGTTQPPLSACLSPGTSLRSASSLSLSVSDTSGGPGNQGRPGNRGLGNVLIGSGQTAGSYR